MLNTIVIIELKRYGWRQKVVKSSFVIFGKSPYVELIRPEKLWKATLPRRNGRCFVGEYLSFKHAERAGVERVNIG